TFGSLHGAGKEPSRLQEKAAVPSLEEKRIVMDAPVTSASEAALSMNTAGAEVSTMKAALCAGPAPIVGSGLTARTSKAWLPSPSVAPPSEAEETVALGAAPHAVHG